MTDLTEKALEDFVIEAGRLNRADKLTIKPTKMLIRRDIIQELAAERGISFEEMLVIIKELVRKATDAPQLS